MVGSTSNDFVIAFQVQNEPSSSRSAIARSKLAKSPKKTVWHRPHRITCEELEFIMRNYTVRPGLKQLAKKKVKMPAINVTSMTAMDIMEKRKQILSSGCYLETFFRRRKFLEMDFENRLELQNAVARNSSETFEFIKETFDFYMNGTKLKEHRIPSGWSDSTRSIFMLDKSKIMTCLPLKTGTTNWQKTLASIMVHEKTGRLLDPMMINDVFDDVPRYYTNFNKSYLNPSMKNIILI